MFGLVCEERECIGQKELQMEEASSASFGLDQKVWDRGKKINMVLMWVLTSLCENDNEVVMVKTGQDSHTYTHK
jgi:hypothetical protein